MAYFNNDDVFETEHKILTDTVRKCKEANDSCEPYSNAYFLGMIDGVVALAAALVKGENDG